MAKRHPRTCCCEVCENARQIYGSNQLRRVGDDFVPIRDGSSRKKRHNYTPNGRAHVSRNDGLHVTIETDGNAEHHMVTPDEQGLGTLAIGQYQEETTRDVRRGNK